MPTHFLRTYPDRHTAWRACVFLMEEGLLARPQDVLIGTMPGIDRDRSCHEHWVTLAFKADLEHAGALLDEFDAAPPTPDSEWADEAEPDLTRLPTGLTIPCETCGYDLRPLVRPSTRAPRPTPSTAPIRCPECGTINLPLDRVLARHGPEALLDCYPDDEPEDPDWTEEAVIRRLHLPCPHCRCPLHALDLEGHCPACAQPYNKRAIVRHAFDAL
jgi:hypothetical protein